MEKIEMINPFETTNKEILEVNDRLWATFTIGAKTAEIARFFVANKSIKIIYGQAEFINSVPKNNFFALTQSNLNSAGENRAVDFNARGISDSLIVKICFDVKGLLKGDKITFYTSFPDMFFKNITIQKYRPDSNLETILEKSNVPNGGSFYLNWPWN